MTDKPKVFADNTLTICIDRDSFVVYAGQNKISLIQNLMLEIQDDKYKLSVIFPSSTNSETNLKVEEQMRQVKALSLK